MPDAASQHNASLPFLENHKVTTENKVAIDSTCG
ncbi:hypothetical protein ANO14919_039710 [Xylariales sp. No.14919]|nr:hypothetical protein ANO14919_039710 [Xylariales sp. No.14919]